MKSFNDLNMVTSKNFNSVDMAEIFSAQNVIQTRLDVEAALSRAEARLGIVPQSVADEVTAKAKAENLDVDKYVEIQKVAGHELVTLIRSLQAICTPETAGYIHWGATSQDIMDTAQALQLRQGLDLVVKKVKILRDEIAAQAEKYKNTVMMGRTHGQHAMPLTLGFKFAMWIDELDRCLERIADARKRIETGSFFGAVGTMAAVKKEEGRAINKELMKELGLSRANIAWFVTRDRPCEYAVQLAFVCGALRRIGTELFTLMRTEIDEVVEGHKPGQVGSSTMPQKRNPHKIQRLTAFARIGCNMIGEAFDCLENEQERDLRRTIAESIWLPRISCATDGALDAAIDIIPNLEVKEYNMARNIDIQNGLAFSEALMMELAPHIGRKEGHKKIYDLAMEAIDKRVPFSTLLVQDDVIKQYISEDRLKEVMNAANYVGQAPDFVDIVLGKEEF